MIRIGSFLAGIALLFLLAGCGSPWGGGLGDIGHSGNLAENLLAVPGRVDYTVNDLFRKQDLVVYANYRNGSIVRLDIDEVTVNLYENPGEEEEPAAVEGRYLLSSPGRKDVGVLYNSMTARYSIRVWDPDELSSGNSGGGSGGTGIIIIGP